MLRAALLLIGIGLVLLGGYALASGLTYKEKERVVDMGPFTVDAETRKPVPPWVGGVLAAAGVGMILVGARKRSR